MNIEHYRNFIQIVESGSISAGSRILCIAQPALSNQIKAMEKVFGAQLLKRGARNVELTSAGEIIYERAKTICYLEDAAYKEIEACVAGNRGTLWLGLTPAYPDPIMSRLLLDFHDEYPHISFEIMEENTDSITEHLKNGIIEVGVIRTPTVVPPTLHASISIKEQLMIVYRRENPWISPDLECVPVSALKDVPLCISKGFRTKISDSCMEVGFHPYLLSVSASRGTAIMWAERGTAVSIIVAKSHKEQETETLCCRPLAGDSMLTRRYFVVCKERLLSSVAQTFLDFCSKREEFA